MNLVIMIMKASLNSRTKFFSIVTVINMMKLVNHAGLYFQAVKILLHKVNAQIEDAQNARLYKKKQDVTNAFHIWT